jgi:putative tricarboxylic transport membrane protein
LAEEQAVPPAGSGAAGNARWGSDHVAGGVLFLLAVFVGWQTVAALSIGTLSRPGPGYMPLVLAVLLGALGLLVAWRGGESVAFRAVRWPELGHAIKILLCCAFAAAALERLGFRLTILVVVVFLMGVVERRPVLPVAIISVVLSFGTFYLFNDLLRTPLPLGVLGF